MSESSAASADWRQDLVTGLSARVRTLLLSLDRQDRLETAGAFVGWLDGEAAAGGGLADSTREMFLRALKVAGEPMNFSILELLDATDGTSLNEIMAATGLPRVAASERVHDLVQTGLASRELVGDQVRSTPLAQGLGKLVGQIASRAAQDLAQELGGRTRSS